MELLKVNASKHNGIGAINDLIEQSQIMEFIEDTDSVSNAKPFIEANTIQCSLSDIKSKHIIPSFAKDGEPLISHADFIEATQQMVSTVFEREAVLRPTVRLSHEVRGRIPSAKNKPTNQLLEHERTLFYERMMFVVEIPSIKGFIDGNNLSLMVGGVKSFNADNLNNRIGTEQHFKLFIGFKNSVCTNLCVSTDGLVSNLTVTNIEQLQIFTRSFLESYNYSLFLNSLESFTNTSLTEQQFAHLIGRCRMYPYLPKTHQSDIPQMLFGENQVSAVVRDFYNDNSFCKNDNGTINLWRLYNLFTGANKSTYIDSFADKSVNAFSFVEGIKRAVEEKQINWFLN